MVRASICKGPEAEAKIHYKYIRYTIQRMIGLWGCVLMMAGKTAGLAKYDLGWLSLNASCTLSNQTYNELDFQPHYPVSLFGGAFSHLAGVCEQPRWHLVFGFVTSTFNNDFMRVVSFCLPS